MLRLPSPAALFRGRLSSRGISGTRVVQGGQTTIGYLVDQPPTNGAAVSVDHLATAEKAARLLTEQHVSAIPVTQNEKVVGVFTEHDYFEKVLNTQHPALRSSRVCQVAAVGPKAAVVHMDDTVEDCLAIMAKKNLTALPVTTRQGQVVGTISLLDLTRELMTPTGFSEPSDFPETTATASPFAFSSHRKARLFNQLKHDLDKQASLTATVGAAERLNLRNSLEDLAADSFSEASVFPEFTPAEDALFTHTQPKPELRAMAMDPHGLAEDQLAGEMEAHFCEASDFPEYSSVEEAIQLHKK